jgi:HAD superfamily hydrolase (TIGR01662 family)
VELLPGRVERLAALRAEGWLLLGVSNQSGVARGVLTEDQARACFDATNALLGQDVDVRFCPHDSGEIRCWCRKPMPGMGVALIGTHQLDPRECLVVGDQDSDAAFAAHLGMTFHHADDFFR